jgi:hypothetical protein
LKLCDRLNSHDANISSANPPVFAGDVIQIPNKYPAMGTKGQPMGKEKVKKSLHERADRIAEEGAVRNPYKIAHKNNRNPAQAAIVCQEEIFIENH